MGFMMISVFAKRPEAFGIIVGMPKSRLPETLTVMAVTITIIVHILFCKRLAGFVSFA